MKLLSWGPAFCLSVRQEFYLKPFLLHFLKAFFLIFSSLVGSQPNFTNKNFKKIVVSYQIVIYHLTLTYGIILRFLTLKYSLQNSILPLCNDRLTSKYRKLHHLTNQNTNIWGVFLYKAVCLAF